MTFELKKRLIAQYGNIDDANNALHITYVVRDIDAVSMSPKQYFTEVGEYQLSYTVDQYTNNYINEEWSIQSNLYATINSETGVLNVTRIGEELDGEGPNANVTVTLYLMDGSTVSATSNLNFWERTAKIGDVVYHDGTFGSPDDYEAEIAVGKEAVGICFYIDPNDAKRRLLVALRDIPAGQTWGMTNATNTPIELTDSPDLNLYDIAQIPNVGNLGVSSFPGLRDTTNGDKYGWKSFDPYTAQAGQIGWMTVIQSGGGYKAGDKVPYGKYFTACVMEVRNAILTDSAINLEIPKASSDESEAKNLEFLINNAIIKMGSTNYKNLYFPAVSYCYAWRPSDRDDLKEEFKERNWWMPSGGEFLRLAFYSNQYYSETDPELNIFKKAAQKKIINMSLTSSGWFYNVSESSATQVTIIRGSSWHTAAATKNETNRPSRAICAF
jgi:hypothetical protein